MGPTFSDGKRHLYLTGLISEKHSNCLGFGVSFLILQGKMACSEEYNIFISLFNLISLACSASVSPACP
ncbi:hypothetical protein PHYBLDRAFT_157803 [Phycomyces blakesleeanus NRRL 1555(-)]|uniref:Uncharacterized protein n=1 Tax=Phycomyces blakesleeanus (strain ATCC 8743b / DSM 1359 / FGSC 10004 / NBRC 33097 / NRRL 1555) TaxID=763407 RepID=A0A167PB85_PHYB8|nr:hypothetical protein PHYBLDRAFT_157803 [Phycomyces blakesleeanus NRRL 1555(-)]OAD77598.1 hypothetical protein PHYBLDRAFT_157803 [Phycomyces blakesleeanus NRRL 1555(-)]|eukprot:XP_018295638.1 hypothetical protein PHYBLDRAFT_157803 [Phycomyces blakesleeanus NRRL 1555(-)]